MKKIISFIAHIYKNDKFAELLSFIIREIKYFFGFYKKITMRFNQAPLLCLENNHLDDLQSTPFLVKTDVNWFLQFSDNDKIYGTTDDNPNTLYVCINGKLTELFYFTDRILSIFISSKKVIFICTYGKLYRSTDAGYTFSIVLNFSSTQSYFLQDSFTENDKGELFVGEYVNAYNKKWHFGAYLYYSRDNGTNWKKFDFLKQKNINKHIHLVKWNKKLQGLILTDGDNKKKLWYNRSGNYQSITQNSNSGWEDITKIHIRNGGYTTYVESNGKAIFGTDYNGGTNFIAMTSDLYKFTKQIVPDPYRRSVFASMLNIYRTNQPQIWAVLHGEESKNAKSLLMMSIDNGKTWNRIIEYNGDSFKIKILNTNNVSEELFINIENTSKTSIQPGHKKIHGCYKINFSELEKSIKLKE